MHCIIILQIFGSIDYRTALMQKPMEEKEEKKKEEEEKKEKEKKNMKVDATGVNE